MSEMIERVAKAMRKAFMASPYKPGAETPEGGIDHVEEAMARAAIAAMREPTPDVLQAGELAWSYDDRFDSPGDCLRVSWQAMIKKALKT